MRGKSTHYVIIIIVFQFLQLFETWLIPTTEAFLPVGETLTSFQSVRVN